MKWKLVDCPGTLSAHASTILSVRYNGRYNPKGPKRFRDGSPGARSHTSEA